MQRFASTRILLTGALILGGCGRKAAQPPPAPSDAAMHFTDITDSAGIPFAYTFGDFTYDNILESSGSGVAVFDYSKDGLMGILFLNGRYLPGCNDPKGRVFSGDRNALYHNNGDGTFTDVTAQAGLGGRQWAMAAGIADFVGDGRFDILVADLSYGSLYRYLGNGRFQDVVQQSRIRAFLHGAESWGGGLHDFDNDGNLDLFATNGAADLLILKRLTLLANDGAGTLVDAAERVGGYFIRERSGRGAAFGDFDNDGDIDNVVSHVDLQARASTGWGFNCGLLAARASPSERWSGSPPADQYLTVTEALVASRPGN